MLKRRTTQLSLAAGAGLCSLLLGGMLSLTNFGGLAERWPISKQSQKWSGPGQSSSTSLNSQLAVLINLAPTQRAAQLEAIAQGANSTDRKQARYLLASDLIQQKQGEKALSWLQGLEQDYPVLAAHVVLKQAQAYEVSGNQAKAQATWQDLLQRHPNHPAAAEALFALGRNNPEYWDRLITQFPAHPRASDLARTRLQKNPNQPQLLLLLAKHAFYSPGIVPVLDRLVTRYALQLQPADWEAVGFAYWENQEYGKAGLAYMRAPRTPLNMYRAGRGEHLSSRSIEAIVLYQQLVRAFPTAPETATALIRMAKLAPKKDGIAYLDIVIKNFPDRAAEAWLVKADIFDSLKNSKAASQCRQLVLTRYQSSDAAAELRWSQAQKRAAVKDYLGAWQWAQPITTENARSKLAPEAAFWVGKWANRLGKQQEARAAFEYVLTQYPESYYAWRSAVFLGLDVGDFTTVRQFAPQVVQPSQRPDLSVGSPALKELYQLGQDLDAWTLWQVEFTNPRQPTVAEQFTDGVMRLGVGDNLDGLFMVSSLDQRETPEERSQYASLKRQSAYWQALYPFPFMELIKTWSRQRQLNPLLVTALIRQESRFEPNIRSFAGATGLMQVMPETGAWIAEKTKLKSYKLSNPDDSIQLGTWYLDYTHREYNNNSLLAVASYNAGPGNVADWIVKHGLGDPDEFIEAIPFDETRGYVKAVFENYWNYLRLYNPEAAQLLSRYTSTSTALLP